MKQVDPKYYNQKYFQFQSNSPDFSRKISSKDFHKKYQEIASLLKLTPQDKVCDLGCGTGDLSFLLWLKYKCSITAIDYSSDAIKICRQKNKLFKKQQPSAKIFFLHKNNTSLPKLKNIKAVYLCDVIEHLYPKEIKHLIKTIAEWGNPDLLIHTDNNIYLKIFQPILELISLLTQKITLSQIKQSKKFHQLRHVNLTTPTELKINMKQFGYSLEKIKYPKINQKTIIKQLGPLSKFKFLIFLSTNFLKMFPFLSPSFYTLYSKTTQ